MSKASIKRRGSASGSITAEPVLAISSSQMYLQNATLSNKSIQSQHSEMPAINENDTAVIEEVQEDELKEKPSGTSVTVLLDTTELNDEALNIELPEVPESIFPWKDNFFEKIEARSMTMQENVINKFLLKKELDKKMDKKIVLDDLAKDWLNVDKMTLDSQAYLLEKLLPTLIPGIEKMLMEVEKRKLLHSKGGKQFDPINYLGEYLMRNNPNYQKDLPESGYLKAMKQVTKDMKTEIPDTPFHRVFKMKKEVKEKQDQRESIDKIKSRVNKMRKEALSLQFQEWLLDADKKIPLPVIQSAVWSFQDTEAGQKAEIFYHPLEVEASMKDKRDEEGFIEEIIPYVKDLTSQDFTDFLKHLCQCADDFWETVTHDKWKQRFLNLFLSCDVGKVGFLDRERTLTLMENFYDKNPKMVKRLFHNPRYWPFVQFEDIEPAEFWGDLEDERSPFEESEQISEGEMKKHIFLTDEEEVISGRSSDQMQIKKRLSQDEQERPTGSYSSRGSVEKQRSSIEEKMGSRTEGRNASDGLAEQSASATEKKSSISMQETGEEQEGPSKMSQESSTSTKEQGQPPTEKKALIEGTRSNSLDEGIIFQQKTSQNHSTDFTEEEGEGQSKDSKLSSDKNLTETGDKSAVCGEPRSQLIEGKPWSGELVTSDLSKKYMKYGENQKAFLDDHRFSDLHSIIGRIRKHQESKMRSPFNSNYLTVTQFVQILETFMGARVPAGVMKKFLTFFKKNYVETHEEKMNHLEKIQQDAMAMRRKILLEALFQKWDNEGSGFLELHEIDKLLFSYKEGMEKISMMKAKLHIKLPTPHPGNEVRLNVDHFRNYIELVVAELTGNENEVFDNVVEYLMMSLKRTQAEQLRSVARRKWLHQIQRAAETSGVCLEPVYSAVFKALTEDAEAHGNNKKISAHVSLLEENKLMPQRGNVLLRNVACTAHDAPFVLKEVLYRDMKGISFSVVDQGQPIHVPQVEKHGNIHFWNTSRPAKEQRGSFLALPLMDAYKRTFGVLGIDTLQDPFKKNIFARHEISFYQGVTNTLSIAYHYVHSQEHILHVIAVAAGWLCVVAPNITNIITFLVEPGPDEDSDYILRKMMYLDNNGHMEIFSSPVPLCRKENLFRDYIFRCIDTSEVIFTSALGIHHIVVPIRDRKGKALGLLDISIAEQKMLLSQEYKDLQKMLKIVQAACNEILGEYLGEIKKRYILELEFKGEVQRIGVLFFRIMLTEVQERICELNSQAFIDLKNYYDQVLPNDFLLTENDNYRPPTLVHDIIKAVVLIIHPKLKNTELVEEWDQCKEHITNELISRLCTFDPTAEHVKVDSDLISKYIKGNSRKSVWLTRSVAIEYLYHWALTCLCLIKLKHKMENKYTPPLPRGKMSQNRMLVKF
ncbi:EF-hand calcium-binding domain-containing protein 5 isoform X2 [Macrotis lagotis]|uniref:EF-hand calcium-binding domain-containing protein 5 isoform X2 n=1 Tax=Macrotis lagotis TaxID=92651 RepID=UPI003D6923A6